MAIEISNSFFNTDSPKDLSVLFNCITSLLPDWFPVQHYIIPSVAPLREILQLLSTKFAQRKIFSCLDMRLLDSLLTKKNCLEQDKKLLIAREAVPFGTDTPELFSRCHKCPRKHCMLEEAESCCGSVGADLDLKGSG